MSENTQLSEEATRAVIEICAKVRAKNHKNKQSLEISEGIARWAEEFQLLSEKQVNWLRHNARFYQMPLPSELNDSLNEKTNPSVPTSTDDISEQEPAHYLGKILTSLLRIEQLLEDNTQLNTHERQMH